MERKSYLRDSLKFPEKGLVPSVLPLCLCDPSLRVTVALQANHEELAGEEPAAILSVFDYVWYHGCATLPRPERKAE